MEQEIKEQPKTQYIVKQDLPNATGTLVLGIISIVSFGVLWFNRYYYRYYCSSY